MDGRDSKFAVWRLVAAFKGIDLSMPLTARQIAALKFTVLGVPVVNYSKPSVFFLSVKHSICYTRISYLRQGSLRRYVAFF